MDCLLTYIYKIDRVCTSALFRRFASSKCEIEGEPLFNILEPPGLMIREHHVPFTVYETASLSQTITLLVTYMST